MDKIRGSFTMRDLVCTIGHDRMTLSDDAFQQRHGFSKTDQRAACDQKDNKNPDILRGLAQQGINIEDLRSDNPFFSNDPEANVIVSVNRTQLPTCWAHAGRVAADLLHSESILQGLTNGNLNIGESPTAERRFRVRDNKRLDFIRRAAEKAQNLILLRNNKPNVQENEEGWGTEGLPFYEGEQPTPSNGNQEDLPDFSKQHQMLMNIIGGPFQEAFEDTQHSENN